MLAPSYNFFFPAHLTAWRTLGRTDRCNAASAWDYLTHEMMREMWARVAACSGTRGGQGQGGQLAPRPDNFSCARAGHGEPARPARGHTGELASCPRARTHEGPPNVLGLAAAMRCIAWQSASPGSIPMRVPFDGPLARAGSLQRNVGMGPPHAQREARTTVMGGGVHGPVRGSMSWCGAGPQKKNSQGHIGGSVRFPCHSARGHIRRPRPRPGSGRHKGLPDTPGSAAAVRSVVRRGTSPCPSAPAVHHRNPAHFWVRWIPATDPHLGTTPSTKGHRQCGHGTGHAQAGPRVDVIVHGPSGGTRSLLLLVRFSSLVDPCNGPSAWRRPSSMPTDWDMHGLARGSMPSCIPDPQGGKKCGAPSEGSSIPAVGGHAGTSVGCIRGQGVQTPGATRCACVGGGHAICCAELGLAMFVCSHPSALLGSMDPCNGPSAWHRLIHKRMHAVRPRTVTCTDWPKGRCHHARRTLRKKIPSPTGGFIHFFCRPARGHIHGLHPRPWNADTWSLPTRLGWERPCDALCGEGPRHDPLPLVMILVRFRVWLIPATDPRRGAASCKKGCAQRGHAPWLARADPRVGVSVHAGPSKIKIKTKQNKINKIKNVEPYGRVRPFFLPLSTRPHLPPAIEAMGSTRMGLSHPRGVDAAMRSVVRRGASPRSFVFPPITISVHSLGLMDPCNGPSVRRRLMRKRMCAPRPRTAARTCCLEGRCCGAWRTLNKNSRVIWEGSSISCLAHLAGTSMGLRRGHGVQVHGAI